MSSPGGIPASIIEHLTMNITQEMHVKAPIERTFAAMLEQLGPSATNHGGKPMPMKVEAWPGGRWYRDLGDNNGHNWGHVMAIKRPTLLEFSGPLFLSYAVFSNVQYRLSEEPGGTLIKFHHKAFGVIDEDQRKGMTMGWAHFLEEIRNHAESNGSR